MSNYSGGGGSDETTSTSLQDVLAYVKAIARGDVDREVVLKCPEHLAVLAIHEARYVGKKKENAAGASAGNAAANVTADRTRKKRGLQDITATTTTSSTSTTFSQNPPTLHSISRSCSPSLFQQMESRKHAKTGGITPQRDMDDTLTSVSALMYAHVEERACLVQDDKLLPPLQVNSLGTVLLPIRRKSLLERWTLHEIAVFESGIAIHGKNFDSIALLLAPHKNTQQVIEFYYAWKNSAHAKAWKETYKRDNEDDGYA